MSVAPSTFSPSGSDSAQSAQAPSGRRLDLLQDTRELIVSRLSRVIGEALAKIGEDLSALALRSYRADEQQALLEAVSVVREHRSEIELRFRRAFTEVFERRMQGQQARPGPQAPGADFGELSLVDDSVMQAKLAVDRLVHRARGQLDPEEVLGVRARLAALLEREWFDEDRHPASPEAVFEALKAALTELAPRPEVQSALLDAFEPHVSAHLNTVYSTVNDRLKANHVLPRIRPQVPMRNGQPLRTTQGRHDPSSMQAADPLDQAGAPQDSGIPQGATGFSGPAGPSHGRGSWGVGGCPSGTGGPSGAGGSWAPGSWSGVGPSGPVGGAAGRGNGASAHAAGGAGYPQSRAQELGTVLSDLAQGVPAARASATRLLADPETFAVADLPLPAVEAPLLDALTHLQSSWVEGDGATAQLLADITERAREAGSPLDQLTVEIVSMVFDYIYADRRLADVVKQQLLRLQVVAVKAALIDRSFFARRAHPMRRLIDRISEVAADADADLAAGSPMVVGIEQVVERVLVSFERDLGVFDEAREQIELLAAEEASRRADRLARATGEAERAEAVIHARGLAMARMSDRLDSETPRFIRDFLADWWSSVVAEAQVTGAGAPLEHADSMAIAERLIWSVQPKQADEVPRLAAMLPRLINGLMCGARMVSMPDERREAFFDELLQAHTRAIESAKFAVAAARAQTNLRMHPDGRIQFVPSAQAPAPVSPDPPLVEARSVRLAELRRGDSIELDVDGGGEFLTYRLAWISPAQRIYVLSRHPEGATSLDRAQLAAMFDGGRARYADSGSALDKAIESVAAAPDAIAASGPA